MIKVLDSYIADKIAAGEVIDRPVSIVKELVENSIDAGSTDIIIEVRNGGKSYIRVTDNGSGIPSAEVETAFLRHATGKISTLDDLENIDTLGFRGEALASISAVSRLTIYTKTAEEVTGIKLTLHAGSKVSSEQTGMNDGTTVVVEDVFYNTPARKKFMKTDAAETSAIIDLIQRYAIYYAGISFRLISNGKNIISTEGDGDHKRAISSIYPTVEYRNLIEILGDGVHGFISNPGVTKNSRRGQIFFVNGRNVDSSTIEKGIEKGYGERIFSGHPIAILFITVDPARIDVNIHPNKREVKFLEADEIIDAVSDAIGNVMNSGVSIPSGVREDIHTAISDSYGDIDDTVIVGSPILYDDPEEQLGIREYLKARGHEIPDNEMADEPHTENEPEYIESPTYVPFDFNELIVKGVVFNTYIITQARDTLYVLDQHAAHERILYEQLVHDHYTNERVQQPILTSFTIDVPADVYNSDRKYLEALIKMGYDIEDFGNNSFAVRGIPAYMTSEEAHDFAKSFIESPEYSDQKNEVVIDKLIMRSCKSAVKANDKLSDIEINELLTKLSKCINPFSCPHGRPTFISVTKAEIEKAFNRI